MDIGDIVERDTGDVPVIEPMAPVNTQKPKRVSKWKAAMQKASNKIKESSSDQTNEVFDASENGSTATKVDKQDVFGSGLSAEEEIHLENLRKVANMDPTEIEREKAQLIDSLDPNVLASLMRRAQKREAETKDLENKKAEKEEPKSKEIVDEDEATTVKESPNEKEQHAQEARSPRKVHFSEKEVSQNIDSEQKSETNGGGAGVHFTKPKAKSSLPVREVIAALSGKGDHGAPLDDLESSNDFLTTLHDKYFPDLAIESDKLEWMKPIDPEGAEAEEYSPGVDSLAPSEVRFDFRGDIVTPKHSREIDTSKGLHHHGDAPLAAGYTIGELGHLARSTNQSQRCLAIQTLGRILHKLPKVAKRAPELYGGLQGCIEKYRILEILYDSASKGTVSVQAYATEALWLYETGGAKLRHAM